MRNAAILLAAILLSLCAASALSQGIGTSVVTAPANAPSPSQPHPAIQRLVIRNRGKDAVIVNLSRLDGDKAFHHAERLPVDGRAVVDVPLLRSVRVGILRRNEALHAGHPGNEPKTSHRNAAALGLGLALAGNDHRDKDKPVDDRQPAISDQRDQPTRSADEDERTGPPPEDSRVAQRDDADRHDDSAPRDRGSDHGRGLAAGLLLGAVLDKSHKKPKHEQGPPGAIVLIDADDGDDTRTIHGVDFTPTVVDGDDEDDSQFIGGNTSIPISNEPTPAANAPENNAPPPCYCGPDMSAAYVEALKRAHDRIAALPDSEKGAWDGAWFLSRNAGSMDERVRPARQPGWTADTDLTNGQGTLCPTGPCANLPGAGAGTMSLFGHCLPQHVGNDIMYGFAATLLDVPSTIQVLGGDWAQLNSTYASLDPPQSQAAYKIGANIAELDSPDVWGGVFNVESVGRLFEGAQFETGNGITSPVVDQKALAFILATYPALADCEHCPTDASRPGTLLRDWSMSVWRLDDGSSVAPPGASPDDGND